MSRCCFGLWASMSESEGTTRYTNGIGEGRGGRRLFFSSFFLGGRAIKRLRAWGVNTSGLEWDAAACCRWKMAMLRLNVSYSNCYFLIMWVKARVCLCALKGDFACLLVLMWTNVKMMRWRDWKAPGELGSPCSCCSRRTADSPGSGSRWPEPRHLAPRRKWLQSATSAPSATRWWTQSSPLVLSERERGRDENTSWPYSDHFDSKASSSNSRQAEFKNKNNVWMLSWGL